MPDGKGIAQAMQQDLGEVGVNAKLVTYEWGTYLERTGSGDHSMALLGWDRGQRRPRQLPQRAPWQRERDRDRRAQHLLLQEPRGGQAAPGRASPPSRRASASRLLMKAQELLVQDARGS